MKIGPRFTLKELREKHPEVDVFDTTGCKPCWSNGRLIVKVGYDWYDKKFQANVLGWFYDASSSICGMSDSREALIAYLKDRYAKVDIQDENENTIYLSEDEE